MIVIPVTDVIRISVFAELDIEQLWIVFRKGKDFRWIPIYDIAISIEPKARNLPFWQPL